jgi:hypothetical protein
MTAEIGADRSRRRSFRPPPCVLHGTVNRCISGAFFRLPESHRDETTASFGLYVQFYHDLCITRRRVLAGEFNVVTQSKQDHIWELRLLPVFARRNTSSSRVNGSRIRYGMLRRRTGRPCIRCSGLFLRYIVQDLTGTSMS